MPDRADSALVHAVESNDAAAVQRILEAGPCDVNAVRDDHNGTLLRIALFRQNIDTTIVAALLHHGADPNVPDEDDGVTRLHVASINGDTAVMRLLLDHGADPTIADRTGTCPLSWAASSWSAEAVDLLLCHGAEVNARDVQGTAALHTAVWMNERAILRCLFKHGATPPW